jgi:hypothetical protein
MWMGHFDAENSKVSVWKRVTPGFVEKTEFQELVRFHMEQRKAKGAFLNA